MRTAKFRAAAHWAFGCPASQPVFDGSQRARHMHCTRWLHFRGGHDWAMMALAVLVALFLAACMAAKAGTGPLLAQCIPGHKVVVAHMFNTSAKAVWIHQVVIDLRNSGGHHLTTVERGWGHGRKIRPGEWRDFTLKAHTLERTARCKVLSAQVDRNR